MEKFNLEYLTTLRHWFHKNAELSLKEVNTCKKIKEELIKMGVTNSEIISRANTGLEINLKGTGHSAKNPKIICLRADIDGLPIKENNPSIGTKQSLI